MIVDSSAIVAVLRDEPDAESFQTALSRDPHLAMSVASFLDSAIVIDANRDPVLSRRFDDLLRALDVSHEPVTFEPAEIARQAYRDFGKGSGHRAGLNLGDCFSYALARSAGQPLLYKGEDFAGTDVRSALT